jgi:hypothetical protein
MGGGGGGKIEEKRRMWHFGIWVREGEGGGRERDNQCFGECMVPKGYFYCWTNETEDGTRHTVKYHPLEVDAQQCQTNIVSNSAII